MGLLNCCGLFGSKKVAPDEKATQGASPTQTSATEPAASPRPLNYAIPVRASLPSDPQIAAAVNASVRHKKTQSKRILKLQDEAKAEAAEASAAAAPAISPTNISLSPNAAGP